MILVLGVGIFGAFTGYLANAFIAPRRKDTTGDADQTAAQLERLRELASEQQAVIDDLERRLGKAS
jgi:voltage-gated potassium channel